MLRSAVDLYHMGRKSSTASSFKTLTTYHSGIDDLEDSIDRNAGLNRPQTVESSKTVETDSLRT